MKKENGELIQKELLRAKESLKAAQKLLDEELFADAISRAYYACLHAAKAALFIQKVTVSSHRAVIALFGKHLVQTGKIEKNYGRMFKEQQEDREASDYDVFEIFESERCRKRVMDAEKFVKRIKKFIQTT